MNAAEFRVKYRATLYTSEGGLGTILTDGFVLRGRRYTTAADVDPEAALRLTCAANRIQLYQDPLDVPGYGTLAPDPHAMRFEVTGLWNNRHGAPSFRCAYDFQPTLEGALESARGLQRLAARAGAWYASLVGVWIQAMEDPCSRVPWRQPAPPDQRQP